MTDEPSTTHDRTAPRDMDFRAALVAALVLGSASFGLLWAADEATDATAIGGGVGLVIAGSLLGLTILARRWDRQRTRYVATAMDDADAAAAAAAVDVAAAAGDTTATG